MMVFNVQGMQGLGDSIHQRAVVRQLMEQGTVYLETPWPAVYHDLVGSRLHLVPPVTKLRTQLKNAARENKAYTARRAPAGALKRRVWYTHDQMKAGPILKGMMSTLGLSYERADFRLPVPHEWQRQIDIVMQGWPMRPIAVYRPLVERPEWGGCKARNPDARAYAEIFTAAAKDMWVVSIADIAPPHEYITSKPVRTDVTYHAGELPFEQLAALFSRASLVYTSPGFATALAQSVKAPVVTVFGGHEDSRVCTPTPTTLCIDPIIPCCCLSHRCDHDKRIDITAAIARIKEFL